LSVDTERRPILDPEAEQEVDFGRYGRAILARWWLLVAGVVVGAIIGALATTGTSSLYKATAEVYLGQPLSPQGATPVSSAPTQLSLVTNLVTSDQTVQAVAKKVDVKPGKLRSGITMKPIVGTTGTKVGVPAPLIAITVKGLPRNKNAQAANSLANTVVRQLGPYSTSKIQALNDQLAYDTAQLKALSDRLDQARLNQQQVLSSKTISATDKLVALANLNSVITLALQQQNTLEQDRFQVRQQLSLAQDIESSRLVSAAVATRSAGPSRRSAVAVGAVIGLIVGLFAALLWDPVATLTRARPAE
jgi:uncharacterized protein involved in exopolysaccharide biosynthesis